jgi:hypothetical protein
MSPEGDSRTLTIIEGEEGDLRMAYGGATWTEDTRAGEGSSSWCEEAEWYEAEDWSCPHGKTVAQRVSLTSAPALAMEILTVIEEDNALRLSVCADREAGAEVMPVSGAGHGRRCSISAQDHVYAVPFQQAFWDRSNVHSCQLSC